jgi:hypothetical protein
VGNVARMRAVRNSYKILVRESEGKGPPGRSKSKPEDNIRTDHRNTVGRCGQDSSG